MLKETKRTRSPGKRRAALYNDITDKVIADLEQGRFPWAQPWGSAGINAPLGLPRNAATARSYSGINILILWACLFERGYPTQNWITFRQALTLGGAVRKGEQAVTVCYADRFVPKSREDDGRGDHPASRSVNGAGEPDAAEAIPFLRRYTVFNVAQCDGLPDHCFGKPVTLPEPEIVPHAEALARATLADIRHDGLRAYYRPADDIIHLPPHAAFFDPINYYRTLFHELGHWTGHERRLGRDLTCSFGCKHYAREELVAELTTAFVCASLSIVPTVRHADYIGNWLDVLREDSRAIVQAASKASKAADFLLAFGAAEPAAAGETHHEHA
jgi:antirestriction protein ArdC